MKPPRSPWRTAIAVALSAVLAAGCGGETPAEADPELAQQLARVDRAVVTGDEALIRDRVESLVSATETARDAGRLDEEQADSILGAADELLARLPDEAPPPRPSPSTTPSPTITPSPDEDEGDDGDEGDNSGPGGGHSEEKSDKAKPDKAKPDKAKGHGKG
ncbi:MAG: hypothetical protein ACJ72P_14925 [Nocardioides sp.]